MPFKRRVLMCSPKYFSVTYSINPWMEESRRKQVYIDNGDAHAEWAHLVQLYRSAGIHVEFVRPAPGLPDMVFTANAGLVMDKTVLLANFRYPERKPEAPLFERWFLENGYRVFRMPDDTFFEGEGEAFLVGGRIFMGYGFRAHHRSYRYLEDLFGHQTITLRLVCDKLYHLDTCFCPCPDGRVLFYPPAFSKKSISKIEKYLPDAIPVPDTSAFDFICNSSIIDDAFITGAHPSRETAELVESLGYHMVYTPLSWFKEAGGGAKCLTLNI